MKKTTAVILRKDIMYAVSERINPGKKYLGKIQVPGGHVEYTDETLVAAAQRELFEETGLQLPETRFTYIITIDEDDFDCAFFEVMLKGKEEPVNTEPENNGDWQWRTLKEIINLDLMTGLRKALDIMYMV
jgi:8-oxo-dGTP pyrophosphatase MutT (NUDIX family)